MGNDRKALNIPDLDDFAPRPRQAPAAKEDVRKQVDKQATFPSREPSNDGQLNIKGPRDVIERFRMLKTQERRSYFDMLSVLMDHYENNK